MYACMSVCVYVRKYVGIFVCMCVHACVGMCRTFTCYIPGSPPVSPIEVVRAAEINDLAETLGCAFALAPCWVGAFAGCPWLLDQRPFLLCI